jgi:hypothetical protein
VGKRRRLIVWSPQVELGRLLWLLNLSTAAEFTHVAGSPPRDFSPPGRLGALLIFDGEARLVDRIQLSPTASVVQIPIAMWHDFVVLERNTTVLEIKPGPDVPDEFADWAPKEGAVNAGQFVKWATNAAVGANWAR